MKKKVLKDYMNRHPTQPLIKDGRSIRFKENKIVRFLLESGPFDMNQLGIMDFSNEDREQFAQLIGYSFGGFAELDYVSNETYNKVAEENKEVLKYPI